MGYLVVVPVLAKYILCWRTDCTYEYQYYDNAIEDRLIFNV